MELIAAVRMFAEVENVGHAFLDEIEVWEY
jgi:hypothetical protein